jgi:TonB family protein
MRITQLILAGLAAASLAGVASAQDRAADWVKTPSARDLEAVWPAKALKDGIGGKAIIGCIVTVQGTLRACRIESEDPAGVGFGAAAIALSTQFALRPALKDGAPVEAGVRIPINFPRPDRATGSRLKPVTDTDFKGDVIYARLPWRAAPSYAEVLAAYPQKARDKKMGGSATLDCRIGKDGHLSACRTLKEVPEGYGFGSAARSLSHSFVGPTANGKGEPIVGDHAALQVTFAAASLDAATPAIGRPDWKAFPTMEDFTAVVPQAARQAKVYRARVVMECHVGATGALEDCKAASEEPMGLGYADAALALSKAFRLSVWTDEGLPTVGGVVRVPLRFDMQSAMQAKP